MKILNLSVYSWANGGPSKIIHDHAKVQLSLGHEVHILNPFQEGEDFFPLPLGAKLILCKKHWLSKFYPDFSFEVWKYLKENADNYDVIHIHGLWNFPGLIALLRKSKPLKVITIHGTLGEGALRNGKWKKAFFGWLIQKRALKKADVIHIHNDIEMNDLQKFLGNFKHKNIFFNPNGIEFSEFENLPQKGIFRKKLNIPKDKKVILFFGRFTSKKGVDLLLPAFKMVAEKNQDAVLLMVGPDYGMLDFIKNFVKENNLQDRVFINGLISGTEKLEVLVDADVFTLPSYSEGFSIATMEAAAVGLPLVTSDQIGYEEVVREKNAGKIIDLNPDSIAKAFLFYLHNEKERAEVGVNARKMVQELYDIKIVAKNLVNEFLRMSEKKTHHS